MMTFVKHLIAIRKKHPILRSQTKPSRSGYPHYSKHGVNAWYLSDLEAERVIGVMFSGRDETGQFDDYSYIAFNSHWEDHMVELPVLPKGYHWQKHIDTAKPTKKAVVMEEHITVLDATHIDVKARSVCVLFAHYQPEADNA
jgi:glycogen operon protein